MPRCSATERNSEPCRISVESGVALCWAHDPANREQHQRITSRAGKSKPSRELPSIKAQLEELTEQVLSGDLETGPAAVANQLINTRLRAIELERKFKETEEFEERLAALERQEDARWGA